MPKLTAYTTGQLLALYEHRTAVQVSVLTAKRAQPDRTATAASVEPAVLCKDRSWYPLMRRVDIVRDLTDACLPCYAGVPVASQLVRPMGCRAGQAASQKHSHRDEGR